MTRINKKYVFWAGIGFLISAFCVYASNAVRPFLVSFILSYLFVPLIDRLEVSRVPRSVASIIVVSLLFFATTLITSIMVPFLYEKISSFIQDFLINANNIAQQKIEYVASILHVDTSVIMNITSYLKEYLSNLEVKLIKNYPGKTLSFVINFVATAFVMPIIMFYMLKDWRKMTSGFYNFLPSQSRHTWRAIIREIDQSILSYLRGQFNVCLFFIVFYGIALHFVGMNFGVLMGAMVGVLIFIPYIGFLVGCVVSLIVAFVQFGDTSGRFSVVAAIFVVGQLIDANYTTPKFVGDKIGLHPVWIVFGLFASSSLLGIFGAILALPITASCAVFIKFLVARYKTSYYYK